MLQAAPSPGCSPEVPLPLRLLLQQQLPLHLLRLRDQTVPAVQPDPVRHHQLRGLQRGAERMQAEEPYDSLDFRFSPDFKPTIDFCLQLPLKHHINSAGRLTEPSWFAHVIAASIKRLRSYFLCTFVNKFVL